MWLITAKGTLSRLPLVSDLQTLQTNQQSILEEDNKLAQLWSLYPFGKIRNYTELHTLEVVPLSIISEQRNIEQACHTIPHSIQNNTVLEPLIPYLYMTFAGEVIIYCIVSNKRPGGVAIFQKGDAYKRQVFNAKMQCLSLFTMTCRREI